MTVPVGRHAADSYPNKFEVHARVGARAHNAVRTALIEVYLNQLGPDRDVTFIETGMACELNVNTKWVAL